MLNFIVLFIYAITEVLKTNIPVLAVLKAPECDAFPIQKLVTTIGTNSKCDLNLTFTSPLCSAFGVHHADIVFDKVFIFIFMKF